MQFKFLHAADIHLGYQQYGLAERYDDFTEGFQWIIETALRERVAFLLIAGDLFEKRTLDPRTLLIAVKEFQRLKEAGIPVVAIEGNHERTYGENISWMEYLNESDLVCLLDCSRGDHGWLPQAWNEIERKGGYIELAGARIYGLRYQGAQTGTTLKVLGERIGSISRPEEIFSIFACHTSIIGLYDGSSLRGRQSEISVKEQELSGLRRHIDYLALGHTHIPYISEFDGGNWLHNPGCPETWHSQNLRRQTGGAILVKVDTSKVPSFAATVHNNPYRRPYTRIPVPLDSSPSPNALLQSLEQRVKSVLNQRLPIQSRLFDENVHEYQDEYTQGRKSRVVEVLLTGVARFSRTEIDTEAIRRIVDKHLSPLDVRVRSMLQEAPSGMLDHEDSLRRDIVERMVFQNLIRADDRFASRMDDLASVARWMKQFVLEGADPTDIADEARSRLFAHRKLEQINSRDSLPKEAQNDPSELGAAASLLDYTEASSRKGSGSSSLSCPQGCVDRGNPIERNREVEEESQTSD